MKRRLQLLVTALLVINLAPIVGAQEAFALKLSSREKCELYVGIIARLFKKPTPARPGETRTVGIVHSPGTGLDFVPNSLKNQTDLDVVLPHYAQNPHKTEWFLHLAIRESIELNSRVTKVFAPLWQSIKAIGGRAHLDEPQLRSEMATLHRLLRYPRTTNFGLIEVLEDLYPALKDAEPVSVGFNASQTRYLVTAQTPNDSRHHVDNAWLASILDPEDLVVWVEQLVALHLFGDLSFSNEMADQAFASIKRVSHRIQLSDEQKHQIEAAITLLDRYSKNSDLTTKLLVTPWGVPTSLLTYNSNTKFRPYFRTVREPQRHFGNADSLVERIVSRHGVTRDEVFLQYCNLKTIRAYPAEDILRTIDRSYAGGERDPMQMLAQVEHQLMPLLAAHVVIRDTEGNPRMHFAKAEYHQPLEIWTMMRVHQMTPEQMGELWHNALSQLAVLRDKMPEKITSAEVYALLSQTMLQNLD